jgi:hypothetical protein
VLLASSTVRESIMIAALLKLPRSMAHAEKVQRVDDILRELVSPRWRCTRRFPAHFCCRQLCC